MKKMRRMWALNQNARKTNMHSFYCIFIFLWLSGLEQFLQDLTGNALLLVNPTELEIFWQDLTAKALLLVNPTELEIIWQDLAAKALISVPATVICRNILPRLINYIVSYSLHDFWSFILFLVSKL